MVQLTDPERNYHIFYQVSTSTMLTLPSGRLSCFSKVLLLCRGQMSEHPQSVCAAGLSTVSLQLIQQQTSAHPCSNRWDSLCQQHATSMPTIECMMLCLQLCDGASSAEKERWHLKPPQEFHYLNQSSCYNLPRVSNADEYRVGTPPQSAYPAYKAFSIQNLTSFQVALNATQLYVPAVCGCTMSKPFLPLCWCNLRKLNLAH